MLYTTIKAPFKRSTTYKAFVERLYIGYASCQTLDTTVKASFQMLYTMVKPPSNGSTMVNPPSKGSTTV
jgi:hypothetical protein